MEQEELTLPKYNQSIWTKAIETTIVVLVVLLPIIFYPWCITIFGPIKSATAEILIILGLMFWWLKMINEEEIKFAYTPLTFPILCFIGICILSLIWSDSFFVSLKELPLFLAGPLLYFVVTNNISNDRQINRILNFLLLVGGLFGIYGILQYNGIDFPFWIRNIGRQKVFGLFGNVNYFAEYLIIPLPIAVSLFFVTKNKFKKNLLVIAIFAMGISLTVTFTRGSYLGFGISLIFMFFLFLISRGKSFIKDNRKIFIIILIIVIMITYLFVIPNPLNKSDTFISKIKSRISVSQLTQSSSIKRRIATWKFTVLMIKDHPLLGSGIGTYKYNTLRYQAKFFEQGKNRSLYPHGFADKAHNEYLQLWAEMGIIGLWVFIWLIISYFSYGIKILKKTKDEYKQGVIIGLMGAVIAVLVDGLFAFPLHLPTTVILFYLTLGLTVVVGLTDTVNAQEINVIRENLNKIEKKEKVNISRFKPLLFIGIILLAMFLCVTVSGLFIARTYWYYGYKEIKNKNWNKAIEMNEKALKWDPYLGEVYYEIGKILQNKGINNLSLEYFEKAAKYVDHPNLPQDLAMIYLKKGQLDQAATKFKQAISYQSDEESMVPLYSKLGSIYLQLKRYKTAEIAFKDALKINPNFINAHYGLAGAYLRQNQQAEALEEFQKVIELAPDSIEAKYSRTTIQKIAQEKLKAQPTETNNP